MVEQLRGYSSPEDIISPSNAAELLDVSLDADDGEIEEAFRDTVVKAHPDQGGTPELFRAVKEAKELLDTYSGAGSTAEGDSDAGSDGRDRSPGGETESAQRGTGARGRSGPEQEGEVDEELILSIEAMLREKMTEEQLKDKYFEDTTFREVARILASLVLSGNIDLGSLERMVTGDDRFSTNVGSATGGNFSTGGGGNFSRGGGSNFGGNSRASSNPEDYMSYGDDVDPDDDENDEEDEDDGPRSARGEDFRD